MAVSSPPGMEMAHAVSGQHQPGFLPLHQPPRGVQARTSPAVTPIKPSSTWPSMAVSPPRAMRMAPAAHHRHQPGSPNELLRATPGGCHVRARRVSLALVPLHRPPRGVQAEPAHLPRPWRRSRGSPNRSPLPHELLSVPSLVCHSLASGCPGPCRRCAARISWPGRRAGRGAGWRPALPGSGASVRSPGPRRRAARGAPPPRSSPSGPRS